MKFSHNWLNEYLSDTEYSKNLADKLTLAGLEVDSIKPIVKEKIKNIVVGQIKSITKHPNANKLNICRVDIAEKENLIIVCGAKNIYEGMKIPVAKIGAILPNNLEIHKYNLRGQDSFGMMCSEEELGLSKNSYGLMDLSVDAPVGKDLNQYLKLDDNIIEVNITPNRSDCLSIYGIAREISAITKSKLKILEIPDIKIDIEDIKEVNILARDACKSYYGCIIRNVNNNIKTPLWIVEKLRRSGIESISLFVDITNYIMLLTGQPIHAFNFDKLEGDISIRYAKQNECIKLLNEIQVKLDTDTLVIADDKKALEIAGVMEGLNYSITKKDTNIFLESASFIPEKIAGKARKYNLNTDSSHRFERGVDPQLPKKAMKLAIKLITEFAGGNIGPIHGMENIDILNKKIKINLSIDKLNSVLGTNLTTKYVIKVLKSLNMIVNTILNKNCIEVIVPSYRFDIEISDDLIEEVARIYGYSKLPETIPKYNSTKANISETNLSYEIISDRLVNRGYNEVINYSFIDPKYNVFSLDQIGISIKNPISQDLSMMRQSLIPGLINSFKANICRQQNIIKIFENGNCFKLQNSNRIQFARIAGLAYGELLNINWSNNKQIDFFDIKSDIEALCNDIYNLSFEVCDDINWLHPGQSAYVLADGKNIGIIGVIHPKILKSLQIKTKSPIVFEIDSDFLINKKIPKFKNFSKYPSVSRDISFLIDKSIIANNIIKTIKDLNIKILKDVNIFDIYQSNDNKRKNIACNIVFQDNTRTLDDKTIRNNTEKVLKILKDKFNIIQRI